MLVFSANIAAIEEVDDNDEIESIQIVNGQTVIFLDQELQQKSGIKTVKLQRIEFHPEFMAFGKVLSLSPLLSLHNRYLSSAASQASVKIRYTQSEKSLSRLINLHKNKSVSTRKLQEQQVQWQFDKTNYNKLLNQTKTNINESKLLWGHILTQWLTEHNEANFDSLI